jgi:hypothetical protein
MLRIAITGFSADPDTITEMLGIEPTRVRRVIDPGPRRFNGWWFDAHPGRLRDGGDHAGSLTVLRQVLDGRADRFRAVAEQLRPSQMTIYGGLYHHTDDQCGVWLEPDDMALLATCRLGWGLDIFVAE